MGQRFRCRAPKITGLIALHAQHPAEVEATLIDKGLRWRDVGSVDFNWADAYAVLSTAAWDSPIARTRKDWQWGNPLYELLVTIIEQTYNANVLVGNWSGAKQSNLLHIPRPGEIDKHVTKLTGTPESVDDINAWLDGRIQQ